MHYLCEMRELDDVHVQCRSELSEHRKNAGTTHILHVYAKTRVSCVSMLLLFVAIIFLYVALSCKTKKYPGPKSHCQQAQNLQNGLTKI